VLITIRYKQSTRQTLLFFDAKKEPKKDIVESPQLLERFKVDFI